MITINEVQQMIEKLEAAGEISMKEEKYLALAKAYQQLAAENVALKEEISNITFMRDDDFFGSTRRAQEVMGRLVNAKTPATDRIVAGIKADGVESGIKTIMTMLNHQAPGVSDAINVLRLHSYQLQANAAQEETATELSEGADK